MEIQQQSQPSTIVKPIMKPILNHLSQAPQNNLCAAKGNGLQLQHEESMRVQEGDQVNQPVEHKIATSQKVGQQADSKQKHSKEDVDAGNTLLIFLQELRKNHKEALNRNVSNTSEVVKENNQQYLTGSNTSVNGAAESHYSTSTAGLISETRLVPGHEQNDFNSLQYDPTIISYSTNKDGSVKSDLSNESSSAYVSSEDDQKIYIESGSGPIRKRFRRHGPEFSSENIARHEKTTKHSAFK